MARKPNLSPKDEKGQSIVLIAAALIALVAFVGLATDVALIYVAQRHLQRAIDAAALAAANKLPDQTEAQDAAYEFARLHDYSFAPGTDPLNIAFPITNPPRKIAAVTGTITVDLAFLQVIGWDEAKVTAVGVGESAPLDVYVVLDLSNSMVYDTSGPPACWPSSWDEIIGGHDDYSDCTPAETCPASCPFCTTPDPDNAWSTPWWECRAYFCNDHRTCDPLDTYIKPAAKFFVDQLDSQYDRIGIVSYDTEGRIEIPLSADFTAVKAAIDNLEAFEPFGIPPAENYCTNIGDGINYANQFMSLPPPTQGGIGGRVDSIWAVVLLTDGKANRFRACWSDPDNCSAQPQTCPSGCANAERWALVNAESSWDNRRMTIYTIGYGQEFTNNEAYRKLMRCIADYTDNGEYAQDQPAGYPIETCTSENFWGVPDQVGLEQAFAEIAERIYTRLIR